MYLRTDIEPQIRLLASEVFNRSWHFLEQDPVLAGEDRESLQEQLGQLILLLLENGERNMLAIANKAIGALRQQYATEMNRVAVEEAA